MTQLASFINGPLNGRKILMSGPQSAWPGYLTIADDQWSTGPVNYKLDPQSANYHFTHIGNERNPIEIAASNQPAAPRVAMRFVGGRLDGQELDVLGQTDQIPSVMHMVIDEGGDVSAYYVLDREKSCYRFSHYGQPPASDAANLIKRIPTVPDDL